MGGRGNGADVSHAMQDMKYLRSNWRRVIVSSASADLCR